MITGHALVRPAAPRPSTASPPTSPTWGKALGNGFAVSALAGERELMELGGLRTDASRPFLLSTTHGPETTGLAAYLAVAEAYRAARRRGASWSSRGAELADGVERGGGRSWVSPTTSRSSGAPRAWSS